ncbi:MAG: tetratricopeptide repeat protein [Deltaproteobacteria bacterium]|nr:tetratricopeptide repeat protein [Deltaproteobacteria bacterium]
MYKIIIEDDEGRITQVPLKWPEITIGRKEGNVIRLTERNVSRYHAKIVKDSQGIYIEDLDSYNGVKINGDRIHGRSFIKDGDIIHIGDYKIILKFEQDRDEITQELPPSVQRKLETTFQYAPTPVEQPQSDKVEEITPVKKVLEPYYETTAVVRPPNIQFAVQQQAQVIPNSTARLVLFSGHLPSQEFVLNKTVMKIGRTEENDIVLDHKSISREHAQIIYENNVFKILDMKSANGVLVNGEQYAKTELKNGDIIELGHLKLKFIDEKSSQVYQETAVVRLPKKPKGKVEKREAVYDEFAKTEPVKLTKKPIALIAVGISIAAVVVVAFIFLFTRGVPRDNLANKSSAYQKGLEEVQRHMLSANWGEAKNQLSVLAGQYPNDEEIKRLLSKVTMEEKTKENYDKAMASLSLKNWDDAWRRLNSIDKDSYYYKLAIKEMSSLKANYIDYHLKQGMAFAKEKKKNLAISEFNLVLELDPGNEVALREKAKLTGETKEVDQQIAMQQKGPQSVKEVIKEEKRESVKVEEREESSSSQKQKAAIAEKLTPQKQKQKEEPQEQPPSSSEPTAEDYTAEGNKLLMKNRIAEAIANYQKAIKLKPNLAAAHRSLGVAYTKIGQVDKAAKEYETYLKLQPDAPDANQVRQILEQYYKSKGQ